MKRTMPTKRKFFLRRAGKFFLIMMIPMTLMIGFSLYFSFARTESEIAQQGRQTISAVESNCELIITNAFMQNDLLTANTRASMALRHTILETSTSYTDAVFLSSLRSALKSVVGSRGYIDSIYIYLREAPRYFDSDTGVMDLSSAADKSWLECYEQMPTGQKELICLRKGEYGQDVLTFIKRLLLQDGCTVVNIRIDHMQRILRNLMSRSCETVTLTDAQGQILLQTCNADIHMPDAQELLAASEKDGWLITGQGRYYVNSGSYGDMRIYATADERLMQDRLGGMYSTFLILLAVNVAVVLMLAYVTTRRSFAQIGDMIDLFERAEMDLPVERPQQRARDEYDVVMNNIIYMNLKEIHLRGQLKQKQYEKEHSELRALQLQINPHFLYNTLQTLEMEIRTGKANGHDTGEMVRRISDILRYALSDPHEPVPLQEELAYLRKYAAVQEYRFGDRFVLYFDVEDELLQVPVFRLMLQPVVENSLLHGMNGLDSRMYIWVKAEKIDNGVAFSVSDTGVGMTQEQKDELLRTIHDASSRSIGLTNLNRRLLLHYGARSELSIVSEPGGGTTISFVIPLE